MQMSNVTANRKSIALREILSASWTNFKEIDLNYTPRILSNYISYKPYFYHNHQGPMQSIVNYLNGIYYDPTNKNIDSKWS